MYFLSSTKLFLQRASERKKYEIDLSALQLVIENMINIQFKTFIKELVYFHKFNKQ